MSDFISIKNFKHLFKLLNIYSQKKYNIKLNFKNFKKIIGNSMYEINDNFGDKLSIKKKNIVIIKILKEIIDEKQQVDNFFQIEDNFTNSNKDNNDNLFNINNYDNLQTKQVKEVTQDINILEKRLENEKEIYKKIINNNNNIDDNIQQKRDIEKYMKEIVFEKPVKENVNIKDNIENSNQQIIISPDEYKKSINKYIKKVDLLIDSRDRDYNYDLNNYIVDLNDGINNIFSMELVYSIIPNSEYILNLNNNILHIEESLGNIISVEIPIGNYTKNELILEIENSLNNDLNLSSNYTLSSSNVSITLNNIEVDDSNFINYTGNNIFNIFNNDISNFWSSDLALNNPSFFIYDFKKDVIIKEYSFISKNLNRPKDFTLEISKDGINWTVLQNVINQTTSSNRYKTYSFNNNISSRYVRYSITNSSGGNNVPVAINNMIFVTYSNNKIQIESDLLNNEQSYFNLRFYGGTKNFNGHEIPYYLERSIGSLIGFLPQDRIDNASYTSDNDIILKNDKIIKLDINDHEFFIEFESNISEYNYKNETNDIRLLELEKFDKLNIKIKNTNNTFYNFNGLDHSFLLRLHYYNTNRVFLK